MEKRVIKRPRLIVLIVALCICIALEVLRRKPELLSAVLPYEVMQEIKSVLFMPFYLPSVSFAEILIYAAAAFVLVMVVYFIVRLIKGPHRGAFVINFIIILLAFLAILYAFFLAFCGVDYSREYVKNRLGIEPQPQSTQVLYDTARSVQTDLNRAAQKVMRDENGIFTMQRKTDGVLSVANDIFESYCRKGGDPWRTFSPPKAVWQSEWLNYLGISGFYFAFTGEANVNTAEGSLYLPYTACHEKAHQHGVMREDEASFLAYVICVDSGDDDFRYSALMKAYSALTSSLYYADRTKYFELSRTLDPDATADINNYRNHINRYSSQMTDLFDEMNDTYLKAQGQSSGVASYGGFCDYLIALKLSEPQEEPGGDTDTVDEPALYEDGMDMDIESGISSEDQPSPDE